jgi:hypothetical protein
MTENEQVPDRPSLNPELLTPRDMQRAKVALAEVLGDRDPYDMIEERATAVPFTIWCLRSRVDPSFTWEQALDTPFLGDFEPFGPPQIPGPAANGGSPGRSTASGSKRKRPAPATAPGSASSSG